MTALVMVVLIIGLMVVAVAARRHYRSTAARRRLAMIQLEGLQAQRLLQCVTHATLAEIRAEMRRHARSVDA